MVTRFFLNISHEKMSTLAHFVSHCAILLDGKSTAVYRQGISSFLQRRKHHYLVHDKTHANQQGENVRVQFYSSVCKMDKGRQKDGVKKKLLYYTTFFVLCRHLSQRWCNFVDKIIKDGTLGGVSRSCEIWRSPQEFLPKVWRLTQFFLLLRVGMAAAVAAVADNAKMSCRHEQANRFCKLKSGKLKRRKNANLFERVCTIIWCGFLFHISFSTGFTRA